MNYKFQIIFFVVSYFKRKGGEGGGEEGALLYVNLIWNLERKMMKLYQMQNWSTTICAMRPAEMLPYMPPRSGTPMIMVFGRDASENMVTTHCRGEVEEEEGGDLF